MLPAASAASLLPRGCAATHLFTHLNSTRGLGLDKPLPKSLWISATCALARSSLSFAIHSDGGAITQGNARTDRMLLATNL